MGPARLAILSLCLLACSGDANLAGNGDKSLPPDRSPQNEPSEEGESNPTLSGEWDVTGSAPGQTPVTGTVSIDRGLFRLEVGTTLFSIELQEYDSNGLRKTGPNGETEYRSGKALTTITTRRDDAALDTGILRFPVAGGWTFSSPEPSDPSKCTGKLSGAALIASCEDVDFPSSLPDPRRPVHAVKVEELASAFGKLGGRWVVTPTCSAKFEGNTVSWTCTESKFAGTAVANFSPTIAGGYTSTGLQFSALKR